MSHHSWLRLWMDAQAVETGADAERVLSTQQGFDSLVEAANQARQIPPADLNPTDAIVGTGSMDLSGLHSCNAPACLRKNVDDLLSTVWHYFDQIVVAGPEPYVDDSTAEARDNATRHMSTFVDLLSYVKQVGADDLLVFRRRTFYCEEHLRQHATDAGIPHVVGDANRLIALLESEGTLEIDTIRGQLYGLFRDPLLGMTRVRQLDAEPNDEDKKTIISEIAHGSIRESVAGLVSDVTTARALRLPLASSGPLVETMLKTGAPTNRESLVALHLDFPVLTNLPLRELLRLVRDERPYFIKFRHALRVGVREQLSRVSEDEDPRIVARNVYKEVVEPELANLQGRLKSVKKSFGKKLALDAALGTAAASIGPIAAIPLAGFGLASIDALRNAKQYFNQKGDIEQSDMYFLWQAAQHASPQH